MQSIFFNSTADEDSWGLNVLFGLLNLLFYAKNLHCGFVAKTGIWDIF